jgi:hypothetical protein
LVSLLFCSKALYTTRMSQKTLTSMKCSITFCRVQNIHLPKSTNSSGKHIAKHLYRTGLLF